MFSTIIENKESSTLFLEPLVKDKYTEHLADLRDSYDYLNYENYLDDFIDKLNLKTHEGKQYKSVDFTSFINLF